jgi:hypothetical protein
LKTSAFTHSRYQGDRISEVGRRIEDALVHKMNKQPLTVKKLPKTGYPDIEVSQADRIAYLEMKTSSVKEQSGFRYFYYTNVGKIKAIATHLLLDISMTQENNDREPFFKGRVRIPIINKRISKKMSLTVGSNRYWCFWSSNLLLSYKEK